MTIATGRSKLTTAIARSLELPSGKTDHMRVAFLAHACSLEDSHRACRVLNDVSAPVSFPPNSGAAAPLHRRGPRRNAGERERDKRVVTRKRQAEETPGGLVAAHHIE